MHTLSPAPKCPGANLRQLKHPLLDRSLEDPEFAKFAAPWLSRARSSEKKQEPFEAFIFVWVAFNAWLARVVSDRSETEHDSYLVGAAGIDEEMNGRFNKLLRDDMHFNATALTFYRLFPVFKVRTLVESGIPPWGEHGMEQRRDEYRERCFKSNLKRTDYAPRCYREHGESDLPFDWPHVLSAVYQVRCNLFHGGKSFYYSKDRDFPTLAFELLWKVWAQEIVARTS
jgi:hypothetical protein